MYDATLDEAIEKYSNSVPFNTDTEDELIGKYEHIPHGKSFLQGAFSAFQRETKEYQALIKFSSHEPARRMMQAFNECVGPNA
jgi:hypothetical protein